MYEGYYWISVYERMNGDRRCYSIDIEEIYPVGFENRSDTHNFEVLKRISKVNRNGIYTDLDGVRGFVKECLIVPYERVLEKIMRSGFYHTSIDIPSCLADD